MIYPLYPIMFGERGGVSAAGVGLLLGLGFLLTVFFEVPTGVLADKIPRKYVLLLAFVSRALAFTAWLIWPALPGYLLGMVFLGLGGALESGAIQAYLYGVIDSSKKQQFGKFWARVNALTMVSWTAAYVLVTIIGINYPLILGTSIAACLLAALIGLSLPTDKPHREDPAVKPRIFRTAVQHILRSKTLLSLVASALVILIVAEVNIEMISLYYHDVGVETRFVPLLMAAGNLVAAFFFWNLHRFEVLMNRHKLVLAALFTAGFVASIHAGVVVFCGAILIFTRLIRVLQVQFDANLQEQLHDATRATVASLISFTAKIAAAGAVMLIGLFAVNDNISLPMTVFMIGGMLLFILINLIKEARLKRTVKSDILN